MTDNPPRLTDPPPPPRAFAYNVAGAVFNLVALILLLLGQIVAGEVFVALGLVTLLVGIFRDRAGTPGGRAAGPTANAPQPNRPAQNG